MAHTFVKDVMKTKLVKIDSSKSIKDAASMMDEKSVGCVIVTKDNKPIGILTERDFVRRVASKEKDLSSPLSDVMSSPLIVVKQDETVWEAAEIMKVNNIHKVPVQDDGNDIVGILTTSDLVQLCSVGSDSEMRRICDQILLRMQNSPIS